MIKDSFIKYIIHYINDFENRLTIIGNAMAASVVLIAQRITKQVNWIPVNK